MDILAKKLKERAKQLNISNSEAARRIGLEERRYGHYITGKREPDLATLTKIAEVLGTTPNWLLDVKSKLDKSSKETALVERFKNAATVMSVSDLELCVIQAEAVAAKKN
jgi:transcriptional regulator with XRE-family HTH domain